MKITNLLAVMYCVFVFTKTNAQTFLVGDSSCNYVPLQHIVDPFVNAPQSFGSSYSLTTNYGIDIDGDFTNDLEFDWNANGYVAGSSAFRSCSFYLSSPSNYEFVYLPTLSNCGTLPFNNLTNFSALNASLNWSLTAANTNIYNYCLGVLSCNNFCGYFWPGSTTKLRIGFRKILTNDTIYGWVFLKTRISQYNYGKDEIVSYGFKHTLTSNTVTPVFTNTATSICLGDSLSLSASPAGGAFFGTGVTGNIFNSISTSPATYSVYYTKNCSLTTLTLSVKPLPTVAFTNTFTSLCNGDSLVLTATPPGGTFSGVGVSGNKFNSNLTGLGTAPINYYYTARNGCSNTTTLNINVVSVPNLSISSTSSISCSAQNVTLVASGASNYTWSTASTSQSIVVSPTVFTTYSLNGSFASGNCLTGSTSFSLLTDVNPTVTITSPNGPFCPFPTECVTMTASGAATYFWDFYTSSYTSLLYCPNVTKTFTVVGIKANGCRDTAYHTLNVLTPPNVSLTPNSLTFCPGDTTKFYFTGGTGIFWLYTNGGAPIMQVSPPSFHLNDNDYYYSATNFFQLRNYYSTIKPTCYEPISFSIHDGFCVIGIKEIKDENIYLQIFPNPNAGEFEIKGIKEEIIFILNGLGQLIETKNLTLENNFSCSLTNLNNGIYFVGNKKIKQKIVVIK